MRPLASYLKERIPQGLSYRDAAQLCQRLYISCSGVADSLQPLTGRDLADNFAELAGAGWVLDQDSPYRALYGAHYHEITDRGHWLEVMACVTKNPERVDLARGERVAELVGFKKERKPA